MKKFALIMTTAATFASPLLVYAQDAAGPPAESGMSPVAIVFLVAALVAALFGPALTLRLLARHARTVAVRRSNGPFDAVIALVGHKASGKDEFCRILKEKGFTTRRISDAIRAEAKRRGIDDPTMDQLIELGNEGRANGGSGFWAEQLIGDFEKDGIRLAIVNGVRNPGEVESIQGRSGEAAIIVGITAPFEVREKRFLGRGQAGDILTKEAFAKLDATDRGEGQPDDGQQTDRCMAMVWPDNLYDNDGSLEDYRAWVDEFLLRHGLAS